MITFTNYQLYMDAVKSGERNIRFVSLQSKIDSEPFYTQPYSEKPDLDAVRDGSIC